MTSLPSTLTRQFGLLERRLWRMDSIVAITGGIGALLISYAIQFASDRLWDTPHWLRYVFAICGWAGFAVFAWQYGSRWIWNRRSSRALAMIVQQRYRRLGDRLLGIVELTDPKARPSHYSPELCQAAIEQVAGEASSYDFTQAASNRQPRRYLLGFLLLGALALLLAGAAPQAGWNALLRWIWPAADVERYTFVTIEAMPDHLVVAQGEPFEIAVGLSPKSHWRPRSARWHFEGQPATSVPIHDRTATFHIPGQTQERFFTLSIGDVTRSIRIVPMVRPDLKDIRVRLDLPKYLQYPPQEQRIESGSLTFLPGTNATFSGEAVRRLGSAALAGEKPGSVTVNGTHFTTAPVLLEKERDATFTWRDTFGLAGPAPVTIHLTPREDAPPEVELRGLAAAIAVLPEETVPIDLAATDDFGVRRVTLAWQTAAPGPMAPPGSLHEIKIADGQPQAKSLGGHYDLSPALLQIPPDTTLLVRAMAIDYYPNRQPSSSPIYRIHVLSREAHARLVHDEFEKLLAQLEELTRRQEAIMEAGKAVRSQTPQKLANEESGQRLAEQSNDEKQTAAQLKDLAGKMASTLSEALRNPQISPDTLKDWARHAEQMNGLAAEEMPAAAATLETSKTQVPQRSQKLDQALQQEQAILNAMRELEKQTNQSLESMMAQTLAARLRRAAGTEHEIASGFQQMLPDTIGLTALQLPAEPRQKLDSMGAKHADVAREAQRLQEEIGRLFDRTSLNRYGDVAHEMDDYKTEDGLAALGKLMANNVGAQTIGTAGYWGDQFEKWAERLAEKDQSKSDAGGKGGQPDAARMQALMALMRMRQEQEQLREETSVLDEQKKTSQEYPSGAREAAGRQGALRDQVQALQQDASSPVPAQQLEPIGKSMGDAADLLAKPETGKPTYDAQTDAINLLDAVISQEAQKSGQNTSALMAMMGMGIGGRGNGSTAGGTPSQPNVPIPGSHEGAAPEQRTVIQAGGLDQSQLPAEFRDAIESYHRAIEQSEQ